MHRRIFLSSILLCLSLPSFSWNLTGHRRVVEIALRHMQPAAIHLFEQMNHVLDPIYPAEDLVDAAVWLDILKYEHGVRWFEKMHYYDKAFSEDGSPLPPVEKVNAVWAIKHAIEVIQDKKAQAFDKGMALRILLHVTGDLHQPMHGVTRVSRRHPEGDAGGNLFKLGPNPLAENLHAYWDKGAGLLVKFGKGKYSHFLPSASVLDRGYYCDTAEVSIDPEQWMLESYRIVADKAYSLSEGDVPGKAYQRTTQQIVTIRLAQAGCRLAAILNRLADEIS